MSKWSNPPFIPMKDCVKGRVYEIWCRNLLLGVYDGEGGFIGIRTKFGRRYLSTEYHYDMGPPYGTVKGHRWFDINLPEDIELKEFLGTMNRINGRRIIHDDSIPNPNESQKGKMGWWRYEDTGEACPACKDGCSAATIHNEKLFGFLEALED